MKNFSYIIILSILFISCKEKTENKVETTPVTVQTETPKATQITAFKGQQVTGVSVSNEGRIFVNFPRWRKGVKNSVAEITNNTNTAFPNEAWNSWEIGNKIEANKFVGVQSVVVYNQLIYVLDTRSALFQEVVDAPRIFVFNINTKELEHTYILNEEAYHPNSYINDLRLDKKNNKIYFTDSGNSGLVILDLKTEKFTRVLDNHSSTAAEVDFLTFENKTWTNSVNSDGIALDTKNNKLYYHALSGYSLFSIPTTALTLEDEKEIENAVIFEAKTSAPDGMIFDDNGNLYYADLEHNKIMYRKPDGSIHTLIEGDAIKWADTFSIYNGYLYFTNSRINEVTADISNMEFTVNKIALAN
ncbi:L-dopachrome tautomerase-related protein [Lacinutrix algicola]|uniref:L-dopachrome tautomerase-related protein n=1 Tax=Lacinutrix algicola TaxID=342954 RepID=UPI0006E2174D|nr:L-dopachrome tautomerase-related protein [Lacinutrix algicola]